MGRPSNKERLQTIHETAVRQFHAIETTLRDERIQCLQDRRFASLAGAQWEGPLAIQFENRPKLEVNKVRKSINDICEDFRDNQIDVVFTSKDGVPDDDLADTCAALYRSDEQDSNAQEAFRNAFREAVEGGIGAWRLRAAYEDEESEDDERQRIKFEPIHDADSSVFFDLDAHCQDKSDARYCFVITAMTRELYKERYDDDPSTWGKLIHQYEFDWLTADVVFVAEYYLVEEKAGTTHFFQGLDGEEVSHSDEELEENEDLQPNLEARGFKAVREKKVNRRKVHKYLMNGREIMEDQGYIAGQEIPIVPVYGNWWFVDNVERCCGHVRWAKDPQRIKNMQISRLAEISGYSTIQKPIFTPQQVAGHELRWAEDNEKNYAYQLVNPITDAQGNEVPQGPVGYTKPPDVPPAMPLLLQSAEQDIQEILGSPVEADKVISHVSGKTVEAIQQRIDRKSSGYVDNMAISKRRGGKIWMSMARDLYYEPGRKMKGITDQGQMTQIELQKPVLDPDGRVTEANDLSRAKFDIAVNVGPSSISKKEATVRTILSLLPMTQDPDAQRVLNYFLIRNLEGEGIGDLRKWARKKLVQLGIFEPTQEEAKQLAIQSQNQPPDPNSTYLLAVADEASAKAQKARAEMALTSARVGEVQAKTVETLSGVDGGKKKAALDTVKTLHGMAVDRADLAQTSQQQQQALRA